MSLYLSSSRVVASLMQVETCVLSSWSWKQILIYKILFKILARATQNWAMQLLKFTQPSCDQLCCRMCLPLLSQSAAKGTQSSSIYKLFDTSDFLISRDNITTVKERWDNCSSKLSIADNWVLDWIDIYRIDVDYWVVHPRIHHVFFNGLETTAPNWLPRKRAPPNTRSGAPPSDVCWCIIPID